VPSNVIEESLNHLLFFARKNNQTIIIIDICILNLTSNTEYDVYTPFLSMTLHFF